MEKTKWSQYQKSLRNKDKHENTISQVIQGYMPKAIIQRMQVQTSRWEDLIQNIYRKLHQTTMILYKKIQKNIR